MKKKGYIAIHRQIEDSPIWLGESFSRGQAWIDLLLLANHKDFTVLFRGAFVQRKRGKVNRSISYLADRWQWTRRKTTKFLKALESDGMVSLSIDPRDTEITIINYDKFQKRTADDTTDSTTDGTADDTTDSTTDGTTNNNVINNAKECIIMPNKRARARGGRGNELLDMLRKGDT